MLKVYLTYPVGGEGIPLLSKKHFEVSFNEEKRLLTKDELKKVFSTYDAVITLVCDKIDDEVIGTARGQLKVISNYGVGFDNIDVLEAKRAGIIVTNTPGVANESVAEHTFALILAVKKRLVEADSFVRAGKYKIWDPALFVSGQLWGQTIGIVGLGKIGTFVGQIAYGGFRMKIIYFDISRSEDFELLCGAEYMTLEGLLRNSDIVTIHAPLSEKTHHLIGKAELEKMKKSAILINTARGPIVDEEALISALSQKLIAGAGLDVYENEPHIPQELKTLSNVILTPHVASATLETRNSMSKIAAQNVIDVFEGKEPFGLVKVT